MKKTCKKIMILLLVLIAVLVTFNTNCYAKEVVNDGDASTYQPDEFTTSGKIKTGGDGVKDVKSVGGQIVGIIQIVGTITAVGMLIVLGIKYMMGSAEERAEYKKTLFPYFVGAVLIFGASNLAQVIYTWASKL